MDIITQNVNEEFKKVRAGVAPVPHNVVRTDSPKSIYMPSGHRKSGSAAFTKQAADIVNQLPPIKDPRLNPDNFYLPQFDARSGAPNITTNQWIEYYYKYHPLVGNAIELHSQLPISRFGLTGVEDPAILQVYEEMVEDVSLLENMYNFLKCWWLFGEVQPYFFWGDDYNRFIDMTFIDTSQLNVISHYLAFSADGDETCIYELTPDPLIQSLINSNDPLTRGVADLVDDQIKNAVRTGKNIELDPFSTELIANKAMPWDIRGTSIITGILKDLLYSDSLRLAQNAIAQGYITPKWIWKLGTPGPDGYMPTDSDLSAFRDLLLQANNDPVFNIITHYGVSLDIVGAAGKILPIVPELDWVDKRIMIRLFTNKSLTHGESVNYASASVGLRALMSRYLPIRAMMESFFQRKMFLPVALANDFFKRKQCDLDHGVRTSVDRESPIIPDFDWRHKQSLLDDSSIRSTLLSMRSQGDLPLKVLCDALDLNYEEVMSWLGKEQGTIADRPLVQARGNVIQKAVQQTTSGVKGFLESIKGWFLPVDQQEVDEVDEGKDVPDGYDATVNDSLPDAKDDGSIPAGGMSQQTETGGEPRSPLGGEAGERVLEPKQSFSRMVAMKKARRPQKKSINKRSRLFRWVLSDLHSDDHVDLNAWQTKLRLSPLDKISQDTVIGSENHVLNVFDKEHSGFVDRLITIWDTKGSIAISDFEHALRDSIDSVNTNSFDDFKSRLELLYENAQGNAVTKMSRSKRGRLYISVKRAQMGDVRDRNMNDSIGQAFQRVTTVSDEIIDAMREKLHSNQDDLPQNIVKTLFDELDATALENLPQAELEAKLKELWDSQRYIYQRIIRTETMNMYSRAGLQEWYDAGYTRATRREINDHRTCSYCRSVDGLEFDIAKLLDLEYPLIQNPETKKYEGHPHCFVNTRTPVETVEGQTPIGKIKKGDLVLTHRGRFKRVSDVFKRRVSSDTEYVEIEFRAVSGNYSAMYASFIVTLEHPILTNRGWVKAGDIKLGDVVKARAEKCINCGTAVPYNNYIKIHGKMADPLCVDCRSARRSESMKESRNRPEVAEMIQAKVKKTMNTPKMKRMLRERTIKQMVSENRKENWSPEKKRAATANLRAKLQETGWPDKALVLARKAVCHPSLPQMRLFDFMKYNFGDDVKLEFRVDIPSATYRVIDVALPSYKIGIEYDGAAWHTDEEAELRRDAELQSVGWTIIHTTDGVSFKEPLKQVRRIMANHNGEYLFAPVVVGAITKKKFNNSKLVYNLTVEDDNSFIARGIAVHNCRGTFSPVISFKDWDDFMPPPESIFENVKSVTVGDSVVDGVPFDFVDDIEKGLQNNNMTLDVEIVPDIVDTNKWIEDERARILKDMGVSASPNDIRVDMMLEEEREAQRGQVALYEADNGDVLVSGFSFYNNNPDWFIVRKKGQELFDNLTVNDSEMVQFMYDSKIAETGYSMEDDGLEIIGNPVGNGPAGFITPTAGVDAQSYFIESYSLYQSDPFKLEFLDSPMFNFIKGLV